MKIGVSLPLAALMSLLSLSGCTESSGGVDQAFSRELKAGDAREILHEAAALLHPDDTVLFICGPSRGVTVFADELPEGFQEDGISDGATIFVRGRGEGYDLIYRDASGIYRASKDGGLVKRMQPGDASNPEVWLIEYPKTGVAETYNIALSSQGDLVALSTASKPSLNNGAAMLPARARLFLANCSEREVVGKNVGK